MRHFTEKTVVMAHFVQSRVPLERPKKISPILYVTRGEISLACIAGVERGYGGREKGRGIGERG